MLRIISLNLNGIRSAFRKGAHDWLAAQKADFICVQEVKAQADDLDETMRAIDGAAGHFHFAQQKGYSGVGVYCRRQPDAVQIGFGSEEFDAEGRYVQVDLGALSVVCNDKAEMQKVLSQLKIVVRTNYSNPPTHGGAVVAAVLGNPELRAQWEQELGDMRNRINTMRQ